MRDLVANKRNQFIHRLIYYFGYSFVRIERNQNKKYTSHFVCARKIQNTYRQTISHRYADRGVLIMRNTYAHIHSCLLMQTDV